jgi:PII-like signaling protein
MASIFSLWRDHDPVSDEVDPNPVQATHPVKLEGEQVLLRIFVTDNEDRNFHPLAQRIVERARAEGLAGATVMHGIMGLDFEGRFFDSAETAFGAHLPMVVEIVDSPQSIGHFLTTLRQIAPRAVVTLERAHVMVYRRSAEEAEHSQMGLSMPGPVKDLSTLPCAEEFPLMKQSQDAELLRIFVDQADQIEGQPFHRAVVLKARELGMAGATVLQGAMGYGAACRIHADRILELSSDLPVVIEIVDTADKIKSLLPFLDQWLHEGLITLERVCVLNLRHAEAS